MKCPNCQRDNIDGAFFCAGCGHKLREREVQQAAQQSVPPQPVQSQPMPTQLVSPQPAPQQVQTAKPKKKSKLPVLIVLILLLGAIGAGGYMYGEDVVDFAMSFFKTPEERLVDGFFNALEARTGEIHTMVEIEELEIKSEDSETDKMLRDLLQDMKLTSMMRFDQKARQVEGDLELHMMGTSLVKLDYYVTDEYLIVDVPLLYDEPMYWDLHALLSTLRSNASDGSIGAQLEMFDVPAPDTGTIVPEDIYIDFDLLGESFEEYRDLLDRDAYPSYEAIDWTLYKEVMVPYFEDAIDSIEEDEYEMEFDSDVTYKGNRYQINYNYDDSMDMLDELVEVLADDENVQAFFEEIITTVIARIIENEDYAMYALLAETSMDEIDEWDDEFEDELKDIEDDMLDELDDSFKDLEDTMDNAKEEVGGTADMDIDKVLEDLDVSFYIDLDENGYIRSQVFEVEGSLSEDESSSDESISINIDTIKVKMATEFNLLDEEVDIDGIDKDDAVDVGAMNEEELSTFEQQIQENLLDGLMSNPVFSEMMMMGL